jgi:branched-chain amino acid transport system permease protein
VGMYFQTVYPTMSFQAGIKGFSANLLGGLGNIPGAMISGLILGLIESYGVSLFGGSYRNLFAFIILLLVLLFRPNGLFSRKRQAPPEPLTGTFIPNNKPIRVPRWVIISLIVIAVGLPLVVTARYPLQVMINAYLLGLVAMSITLVMGTAGQSSLGQAGFMAIGAYTSALLALRLHVPFEVSLICGGLFTGALGTLLVFPAFRLRAHYVAIATIGIGEIVSLIILNWDAVTNGPLGLTNIPPPTFFGIKIVMARNVYWFTLAMLIIGVLIQWRLVRSSLGRVWRALRDDEVAAQAYGINLNRYKTLAFASSAFLAGLSGAFFAHMYSYINNETFTSSTSILVLTMAILGGMGNILGAILGAVVLTILPEIFRNVIDYQYRYLLYGLVLVLMIRFRPQGLLGTE